MKSRVVKVGNSRGVRIPKPLIEESGISGEVEITVEHDALVIRPAHRPRAHWADAFARMAQRGDDTLLDKGVNPTATWDEEEWEW